MVTNTTMLDNPSLAPGTAIGKGMADSSTLSAKPIDTNIDKKIILFNFFIITSF
jgi:hypothetical protein